MNTHICICICTYKRPDFLQSLLKKLQNQKTESLFSYSIIVVDNDYQMTSEKVFSEFRKKSKIPIEYYVESEKNIALARNKAVQNADGDFVAFIDDDEFPVNDWLFNLYKTCIEHKSDGVLGPVKPYFAETPPEWIIKGRICERPTHKTETILHWSDTRTGNVLIRTHVFGTKKNVFNPDFGSQGEDHDFFKRMIEKGFVFVWCNEAPVYEIVPPERFRKKYFIRRALLQGNASIEHYRHEKNAKLKFGIFTKSFTAATAYSLVLPFTLLLGDYLFMKYLIKNLHHISRLLGFTNILTIKKRNL